MRERYEWFLYFFHQHGVVLHPRSCDTRVAHANIISNTSRTGAHVEIEICVMRCAIDEPYFYIYCNRIFVYGWEIAWFTCLESRPQWKKITNTVAGQHVRVALALTKRVVHKTQNIGLALWRWTPLSLLRLELIAHMPWQLLYDSLNSV